MSAASDGRDLGMDRRILRRDFLNGVAIGVGAATVTIRSSVVAAQAPPVGQDAKAYPPRRLGLRGEH